MLVCFITVLLAELPAGAFLAFASLSKSLTQRRGEGSRSSVELHRIVVLFKAMTLASS